MNISHKVENKKYKSMKKALFIIGVGIISFGYAGAQGFQANSPMVQEMGNVQMQAIPSPAPMQGIKSTPQTNQFLEARKEARENIGNVRNEFLEGRKEMNQEKAGVLNQIKNEGADTMIRVREEFRNEAGEIRTEAKNAIDAVKPIATQSLEEFAKAREKALEEAKRIREEAQNRVEALKTEMLDVVKQKREEFVKRVQEERQEFASQMEVRRAEFEKQIQEQKAKIAEEALKIRDEKKKEIIMRVGENINEANVKTMEKFSSVLEKLESVLANIMTRADKAEAGGQDVSSIRTAGETAKNAISASRASIQTQAGKTYSFTVGSEDTVKSDVGTARDALRADLEIIKTSVQKAREAVHAVATTLAQIPNVNTYDFATPAQEVEQNTQSNTNQ